LHPIYNPNGGELVFSYIMRVVLRGDYEVANDLKGAIRDRKSPQDLGEENRVARSEAIVNLLSEAFEIQIGKILESIDDGPVQNRIRSERKFVRQVSGGIWLPKTTTEAGKCRRRSHQLEELVLGWWLAPGDNCSLLNLMDKFPKPLVFTRCGRLQCAPQRRGHSLIGTDDALSLNQKQAGKPIQQSIGSQSGIYRIDPVDASG